MMTHLQVAGFEGAEDSRRPAFVQHCRHPITEQKQSVVTNDDLHGVFCHFWVVDWRPRKEHLLSHKHSLRHGSL